MESANYILFVLGILGGTDILLYHSISHGIRSHHASRFELIIHSLRGPTYAALFTLLPNFAMHGVYFWLLIALFAFGVAISLADFIIERGSREFFGGLPTGEYVLHIIMAMLFGALVASVFFEVGNWGKLPAGLAYQPANVPFLLRGAMLIMGVMVLYSGGMDLAAALKLSRTDNPKPAHAH